MTRIIIAAGISMLIASIALSQNYTHPKSSSPTPTPKPSTQFQPQANSQWPTSSPHTATAQAPVRSVQSIPAATPARNAAQFPATSPAQSNPTATPVPAPDVNAYLQRLIANSNDKKLHLTVNGKDLALTPFHVWMQKSTGANTTSTCVDTRSSDGRIYDIDFTTTGTQVTGIRIHRINGETVNSGR